MLIYKFDLVLEFINNSGIVFNIGSVLGAIRSWHYNFSCKNSLVRKSEFEFWLPLIYSISKSKILRINYHLKNIFLLAIFFTYFCKIYLALYEWRV